MENRVEKAVELFAKGYNCSQAVFCAFADKFDIDDDTAMRISLGFGGGFGRLREVCGAFSACTMLAGLANESDLKNAAQAKTDAYKEIRVLKEEFEKRNGGSFICRELLGIPGPSESHVPEKRTEHYKKTRPCEEIVRQAALMMDEYLK
ncbi:MAG: C_GCAxxG_C_C family protein [Clostridia bacterium]|nr:C_GCAxxG_C_C family protein [Clostridia bacterium]